MPNKLTNPGLAFDAHGELMITPSETSSPNDFDFLVGQWEIQNRKLQSRLNNCDTWLEFEAHAEMSKILLGIGNRDSFKANFEGKPFEGMTLRLFNPVTKLWRIYWADSNICVLDPPVVGSFSGNIGTFFTKDIFNGEPILVQFQWDKTDADNPVWSQAFSPDNGKTWEWNWYMYHHKV